MPGLCDVALIAYGSNQRSSTGKLLQSSRPSPWESPYRPLRPISSYALAAARHMHQYGTTKEQLGEVAVAARQWAQLNPEAFVREPLTMEDYLKARLVADPFGVRDCCLVTDGAAAVVMTRADRAQGPVPSGRSTCSAARRAPRTARSPACPTSPSPGWPRPAPRAYAQAGVGAKDIDVVELYDAFTINPILFLEDLGFCAKGEGGALRRRRAHRAGRRAGRQHQRRRPVLRASGHVRPVHDRRGGAPARGRAPASARCKDAKLAIAQGNGGELSHEALLILGTEETL